MGNREKMLVVYMTLGYPDMENFLKFIASLESAGADVLEIGIPPKYAKYDGPVIRKSYDKVRTQIKDIWGLMTQVRDSLSIPIIALTYLEDWINELNTFLNKLRESGINGVLFPDLLIDYIDDFEKYDKEIKGMGLKDVIFTSPSVPDLLINKVSKISDLFLYYGVRPTTGIPIPISLNELITRVRKLVENKLIVGFGLSNDNDIKEALSAGADGIAIGTLFIEEMGKGNLENAIKLVKKFRGLLDEY